MRFTSTLYRSFLIISGLNALVSSIHLVSPKMNHFMWQRVLLSVTRIFHGLVEFFAFVMSTFSSSPRITMWVGVTLLIPLLIYGLHSLWLTGFNGKLSVLFFIVFNTAIGITATWADGLPVDTPSSCVVSLDDEKFVRVIEYPEFGWKPDVNYFLAELDEDEPTWLQSAYVEITDEDVLESITDPCEDIFVIFPEYR